MSLIPDLYLETPVGIFCIDGTIEYRLGEEDKYFPSTQDITVKIMNGVKVITVLPEHYDTVKNFLETIYKVDSLKKSDTL